MLTTGFSHLNIYIYIINNESHYFPVLDLYLCVYAFYAIRSILSSSHTCVCVCECSCVLLENFYFIRNGRKMELLHWRYENIHRFFIQRLRLSRKQVIIAIDYHACVKERISLIVFPLINKQETLSMRLTGSKCLHSSVVFHL